MQETTTEQATRWLSMIMRRQSIPAEGRWLLSPSAPISTDQYLFVDGFASTSQSAEEWITRLVATCPHAMTLPFENSGDRSIPPVFGFSYRYPGLHYNTFASFDSIEVLVGLFQAHLPPAPHRVVPIGFSLGAAITLLGVERVTATEHASVARIILIAPLFSSPLASRREPSAHDALEVGSDPKIPIIVAEMYSHHSPWRLAVQNAFARLAERGIRIDVIYSPNDTFAPYLPAQSPSVYSIPIRPTSLGDDVDGGPFAGRRDLLYHLRLKSDPIVLETVCSLLSAG
jgi:predicted esterase